MFSAVDIPFNRPTAHLAGRSDIIRPLPEPTVPELAFQQRFVLLPHLAGGDALDRSDDLAGGVLRMSRQEQMDVIRRDMESFERRSLS